MSQDTFNKLLTLGLFVFFCTMYVISFITGKSLNISEILTFLVPTLNHIVHQITQSQATIQTIKADVTKTVAAVNGTTASNGHV